MTGDRQLADAAATAFGEMWPKFVASFPDGWSSSAPGSVAYVTGIAAPTLNGVIATARDADPAAVGEALDEVASRMASYCMQSRPGSDDVDALAARRGMSIANREPLMVLDDPARLAAAADVADFDVRILASDEMQAHLDVFVPAFESSMERLAPLQRSSALSVPGISAYVGSVRGEPVATGMGVRHDTHVGIFNVGTVPGHRGRGYGSALTARATLDGLAGGATYGFLQSSEMALHAYEQLGYRTVEEWSVWLPDGLGP
ncbi:MAG: GNAT family N-acetyltransferase [Mycobacteriales bacterium]